MNNKTDYMIENAPIDLAGLSRFQLALYVSGLKRNALKVVLSELKQLETDPKTKKGE